MNGTTTASIDLIPLEISPYGVYIPDYFNMDYALPVYGYITPALSIVVTVTNILFVTVFVRSGMKSPTHILLRFMAISDTLTVVIPTPCFIYIYLLRNYEEFLVYDLCKVWDLFTNFIPAITHAASIWLTVVLAFQRFLCVCFPLNVKIWFNAKRTYITIAATYVLAICSNISRFLEKDVIPVKLISKLKPGTIMEGCVYKYNDWMIESGIDYLKIYYWLRALLVQLAPCITMAIFNGVVLYKIKVAERRRMTLRSGMTTMRRTSVQESRESRVTTLLVCFIVLSVLIVEIPVAIFLILYACALSLEVTIIPNDQIEPLSIMSNLLVLASYPLHFALYSCMSTHFRSTLCKLLRPRCLSTKGKFEVKDGRNRNVSENESIDTHM
ncbi:sex peptide receptor-like [Ylistrum balloti]|uniref:sex peptide receptor-like n=1 Tax=Ylistrum balloti TaxID=509963 RepID=UPI002905C9B1|nr:sex peptide receptor-like [Ylistrum balloti]